MTLAPAPAEERAAEVWRALEAVVDPELDEPITSLGFIRSCDVADADVEVHLRLPTSFCSPNFAYLMASDAKDALAGLGWTRSVLVELDDHHDSDLINAGLAADAGYRGTFGHEAEKDLEELRATFKRKAHTAAMERCLTGLLRADADRSAESLVEARLGDLPDGPDRDSLLRRRAALGLPGRSEALVMVDHRGMACAAEDAATVLRRARSTRISIDGNAHFCRGLLATRYPGSEADQTPRAEETFFPLQLLKEQMR